MARWPEDARLRLQLPERRLLARGPLAAGPRRGRRGRRDAVVVEREGVGVERRVERVPRLQEPDDVRLVGRELRPEPPLRRVVAAELRLERELVAQRVLRKASRRSPVGLVLCGRGAA